MRSIIRNTISNPSLVCSGAAGAMCVNTPKALRAGAIPQLGTHRRQKPHAVAQDSQEVCPDELADQLKHVQILSGVSGVVVGVP